MSSAATAVTSPATAPPSVQAPPLTKIVATLGPKSSQPEAIGALLDAGVDVFRLNFSHGRQEQHAATIAAIREQAAARARHVALLGDLQGPKLRVGDLTNGGPVELVNGARVTIVTEPIEGNAERFSTTYDRLGEDVRVGDRVLLDDGLLELRVETIEKSDSGPDAVTCRVVHGGPLKPQKGLNLPCTNVSAPSLTPKDETDLRFAIEQGVDYIALSFVRTAADLLTTKARIAEHGGKQLLIAKIEKPQAIADLEAIIAASDGVMVARGDLGVELSPEAVPMLQKRIIRLANAASIPVITATQMLESMITNPRPTRAEASDVANAILDGTDAVMLSGETAVGAFPVQAVQTMQRIAREVERDPAYRASLSTGLEQALEDDVADARAVAHAARSLAGDLHCRAIAVLTATGRTACRIAAVRPGVPVVAFTDRPEVARQLAVWHGVRPIVTPLPETTEETIGAAESGLLQHGYVRARERVVITGAIHRPGRERTLFLQVHRIAPPQ